MPAFQTDQCFFFLFSFAGAATAYGLYHQFRGDEGVKQISFGVYLLFIGVAMAITVLYPPTYAPLDLG